MLADLLLSLRRKDVDEAMKYSNTKVTINALSMAVYRNFDLGADRAWGVWQFERPNMGWYFRGHPHVHTRGNTQA